MPIYLLMNVGVFTVILSIKINDRYIEFLNDISGMSKKKPVFSFCIAVVMFSMAGIPPFAGFFGKFYIFISAIESELFFLAILGVIASVISAYYYLRIIKIMYFEESIENYHLYISSNSKFILLISILAISLFILYPSLLINISSEISMIFFNLSE